MGYQAADTFDYYNTTQLQAGIYWEATHGSPLISSSYARNAATGSYPNQGVAIPSGGYIRKNLQSSQGTLISFITFGMQTIPSNSEILCGWWDTNTLQLGVTVNTAGAISFYTQVAVGAYTVLVSSASGVVVPSASTAPNYGLEMYTVFSNGSGQVQAWLNGTQIIALTTGLITRISSNNTANQFALGMVSGTGYNSAGATHYYDYARVWDNTGTTQNAPTQKDVRKLSKLGKSAGTYSQWSPVGTSPNYACTNQNPVQTADYVSGVTTGLYDSYGMGTAGFTTNPNMVLARSYAKKVDSATHTLEIGVLGAGSSVGLGSPSTLTTSYTYTDAVIATDPATGNPPLAAAADAFQHLKYLSS